MCNWKPEGSICLAGCPQSKRPNERKKAFFETLKCWKREWNSVTAKSKDCHPQGFPDYLMRFLFSFQQGYRFQIQIFPFHCVACLAVSRKDLPCSQGNFYLKSLLISMENLVDYYWYWCHTFASHTCSHSRSLSLIVSKASHVNQVLMMFDVDDDEGIYSVDSFNEWRNVSVSMNEFELVVFQSEWLLLLLVSSVVAYLRAWMICHKNSHK